MVTAAPTQGDRHPLKAIVDLWLKKLELGRKRKFELFGKWADEAMRFFDGAHDWMWREVQPAPSAPGFLDARSKSWQPTFKMTYNRVFEAVALLGPSLYFRNPNVLSTPREIAQIPFEALRLDPNDYAAVNSYMMAAQQQQAIAEERQATAGLYSTFLSWLQQITDKRSHVRLAISDALIKGAGYLWCELDTPRGSGTRVVRSTHVNADDIVKDPDATTADGVMWISRHYCEPMNIVEAKFGLPPNTLKGHLQSFDAEANLSVKGKNKKRDTGREVDRSFDLLEYDVIFSKNGFGQRLKSANPKELQSYHLDTEPWGDYCMIVVAKGIPYPLNLPSQVVNAAISIPDEMAEEKQAAMDDLFARSQWPCPFFQDEPISNGWPYVELGFYPKSGSVWPVSIFKPVAGEMRFINWCLSFLADKVAASCQTIVAIQKAAAAEIKDQIAGASAPFTVIELAEVLGKSVTDVVSFLNSPSFSTDIWKVVAEIDEKIDKRLGLTELVYGLTNRQMRSAEEAKVRDDAVSIRPDDMANTVEDFISASNLKEAECARYHLTEEDLVPVLGPLGGLAWTVHQTSTQPDDVVRELSFHIEAGSAKKPNKQNKVKQLQEFGQMAMPFFQQMAMGGMVQPFNAYLTELAKAMDLDPEQFLVTGPPPPPPEEQAAQQAEQQQADLQLQNQQASMMMGVQQHAEKMRQMQETHKLNVQQNKEKHQAQMRQMRAKQAVAGARR